MTLGGNKNLYEFFLLYNLCEESMYLRYKTYASEYYRQKVMYNKSNAVSIVKELGIRKRF
jgi:hypothetical protein